MDKEDLEYKEQLGEVLPYEKELIPNYDDTLDEIDRTIRNREIIE